MALGRRISLGLAFGAGLLAGMLRPAEAASIDRIALEGGRLAIMAVPAAADRSAPPLPAVVFLHDAGRTAEKALQDFNWLARVDAAGFILVAPQSLPTNTAVAAKPPLFNPMRWNDGSTPDTADDVAFVISALDEAARRMRIAPDRVYIAGFAEGGAMAQRIAATRADRFAALASVGGHLRVEAQPVRPLPVMLVFGGRDPQNPTAGGPVPSPFRSGAEVPAMKATVEAWRAALGCDATPSVTLTAAIQTLKWAPCPGEASLTVLSIDDQGHGWPGQRAGVLPARLAGPDTRSWDATAEVWAFFAPLGRPAR